MSKSQSASSALTQGEMSDYLPIAPPPPNHGRTGAAWTLCVGGALGALITAFGFASQTMPLMYGGIGVLVLTVVASIVLRAVGLGQVKRVRSEQ